MKLIAIYKYIFAIIYNIYSKFVCMYNTNSYLEELSIIKLCEGTEDRAKKQKAEGVKPNQGFLTPHCQLLGQVV